MEQETTFLDKNNLSNTNEENRVSFLLKLCHELKSPIHGIGGISEYLCDNWDNLDDDTRRKSVSAICNANKNLSRLVDSLLNNKYSQKKIEFNFIKLDLIEATKATINVYKDLYINKNNIKIKLETKIDQCFSMVDRFWYGQLLTNLLANAVNYSKGGTITVKFSINKINQIDNYVVCVHDEGVGIPNIELDTIFNPFNRGSRGKLHHDGTGLGLSICREIVEAHNGTISASNNQKIGATFKFSIPIKLNNIT